MAKGKNGKPSKKDLPTEIKVKIVRTNENQAFPTSGAMGAVHPDGSSVVMHLYYEHNTLPDASYHPVNEDGIASFRVGKEEKDSYVTRTVHSTVVLSPYAARQIGKWLIDKSEQAETIAERIQKEESNERDSH